MSVPNRPSVAASLPDPALIGGKQEAERGPAARPAPAPAEPPVKDETPPSLNFKEVVRANLHAAAQHAMLGHKAPSFRECSHSSCRNASNLVPYPVVVEKGVTDADLDEIFQRVVPAALEKAASSPAPIQMAPDWPDEPELVS
jgi:hypothetical protein